MIPTHSIYELFFEMDEKEVIFYRGYVYNRPVDDRLREHLNEHKYFTQSQLDTFLWKYGGKLPAKNQMIIELLNSNIEVKVRTVIETPSTEELDEEYYIQLAKNDGHPITNVARGGIFQPHALVKGKLIETSTDGISTKQLEMKKSTENKIQLRMTPSRWKEFIDEEFEKTLRWHKMAPDLVPIRSWEEVEAHFKPLYVPILDYN